MRDNALIIIMKTEKKEHKYSRQKQRKQQDVSGKQEAEQNRVKSNAR